MRVNRDAAGLASDTRDAWTPRSPPQAGRPPRRAGWQFICHEL